MNQELTLTVTISPVEAENKAVTWASDKPGIAEVDENGMVRAVTVGTAVITVTTKDGGHTDTCEVTVQRDPVPISVTGVSLSPKTLSLAVGTTGALTATVTPPEADNQDVIWASSDTKVATVGDNGRVRAIGEGTAVITVTTADGNKTDTCEVTVSGGTVFSNTFTITNTGEWNSAIEAVKDGGDNQSYTLVIDGTVGVPGTEDNTFGGGGVSVTVQGSGELALTSRGRIFTLGAGQTLILGETGGSGPTLRGLRENNGNDTSTVYVNGGEFTMNGGTITGNLTEEGGGVYVNGGTFIMNGGTITMNDGINKYGFERGGGGVFIDGGEFTMNGGTITRNLSNSGGGVFVNSGTFTMNGGEISSNTASPSYSYGGGGGVYVWGGEFTMNGGRILNNSSDRDGGGVEVNHDGAFTMTGGTIISNYAGEGDTGKGDGGGVDVNDSGAFTKSGGSIINNHCEGSGNGTQVYYDDTPPRYRNSDLGEGNNISTADPANWQIEEEAEE